MVNKNNNTQIYSATPNNQEDIEKGTFQKLLDWFRNFGKKKYEQSEEFLQAKVEREKAEAFKARAEGIKHIKEGEKFESEANLNNAEAFAKMKETVERFNEIEQQKMLEQGLVNENGEILEDILDLKSVEELQKELEEKIKMLRIIKGTEIKIKSPLDNNKKMEKGSATISGRMENIEDVDYNIYMGRTITNSDTNAWDQLLNHELLDKEDKEEGS